MLRAFRWALRCLRSKSSRRTVASDIFDNTSMTRELPSSLDSCDISSRSCDDFLETDNWHDVGSGAQAMCEDMGTYYSVRNRMCSCVWWIRSLSFLAFDGDRDLAILRSRAEGSEPKYSCTVDVKACESTVYTIHAHTSMGIWNHFAQPHMHPHLWRHERHLLVSICVLQAINEIFSFSPCFGFARRNGLCRCSRTRVRY